MDAEGGGVKLSNKMAETLTELAKPGAKAHYMPYMGSFNEHPYWFLSGNMRRCSSQIVGLLKRGLVRRVRDGIHVHAVISDEGRKLVGESLP